MVKEEILKTLANKAMEFIEPELIYV